MIINKSANICKEKTVAFSGHRILRPAEDLFADISYAEHSYDKFTDIIRKKTLFAVKKLYDEGYDTFLCGMAEGFDLLAGEVVVDLQGELPDLRLVATIPFPGQAKKLSHSIKRLYEKVLNSSSGVFTICDRYSYDCFHRRNDFLIAQSSALICFYNGTKGGTEYTMKKALREGLKITYLI